MTTDVRSIYTTALRNTHAMEQQGLQQMELQLSRLERYPEYAALLRQHGVEGDVAIPDLLSLGRRVRQRQQRLADSGGRPHRPRH